MISALLIVQSTLCDLFVRCEWFYLYGFLTLLVKEIFFKDAFSDLMVGGRFILD